MFFFTPLFWNSHLNDSYMSNFKNALRNKKSTTIESSKITHKELPIETSLHSQIRKLFMSCSSPQKNLTCMLDPVSLLMSMKLFYLAFPFYQKCHLPFKFR